MKDMIGFRIYRGVAALGRKVRSLFKKRRPAIVLVVGNRGTGRTILSILLGAQVTKWFNTTHQAKKHFGVEDTQFRLMDLARYVARAEYGETFVLDEVMDAFSHHFYSIGYLDAVLSTISLQSLNLIYVMQISTLPPVSELLCSTKYPEVLRRHLLSHRQNIIVVEIVRRGVARVFDINSKFKYHRIGRLYFGKK